MKPDFRNTIQYKRVAWYRGTAWLIAGCQWLLWKIGIPWHNRFSNECTPDFNCCVKKSKSRNA